ncbi:MAG: extensin family protein, partial [Pseudomonadota bacterium]
SEEPKPSWSGRARFLKEAHKRACRRFGTTLGPEANNAHRNHFHVDLAPRKRSNYCR